MLVAALQANTRSSTNKAIRPRTIVIRAGAVIVHIIEAGRAVRQVVVVAIASTTAAAPAGKCRGGHEGRRRVVVRGGRGGDASQSLGAVCMRGEGGERERRGSHRHWAEAEHHLAEPKNKPAALLVKKEMTVCEETTKSGFGGCDVRQKNHLLTW